MHDVVLAPLVSQTVAPNVDHEQHDRPRAEIERYARSHEEVRVTGKNQLMHSPLLDIVHANDGAVLRALSHLRIAIQVPVIRYRGQLVHVNNVIDCRVFWSRHSTALRSLRWQVNLPTFIVEALAHLGHAFVGHLHTPLTLGVSFASDRLRTSG